MKTIKINKIVKRLLKENINGLTYERPINKKNTIILTYCYSRGNKAKRESQEIIKQIEWFMNHNKLNQFVSTKEIFQPDYSALMHVNYTISL